jgi:hypothetical protein
MLYMSAILDELTLYRIGDILTINISFIEGRCMVVDILHRIDVYHLSCILADVLHVM